MSNLPVLIVGAGPTGLMMACALARQGISFRIIDKKPERTNASNAVWIQTRTLEKLDQFGIAERFIKSGHICDAINFHVNGEHLSTLSLKYIDSLYPFVLMLSQSKTENILESYLNELKHTVERSVTLIDVKCGSEGATTALQHPDGHQENITSDWLIACDGANSLVREKCGLQFTGEDLTEQFMVAEASIDFSFMAKDQIHYFFDPGTVLAAFPLGAKRYRLAANLHLGYPRKFFTEREVIEIVQERAHGKYYVTDVIWISPFWIHGKVTEQMRKGPIFFVGDASHIHSPALGQGMNTGFQDALNLAWKLAWTIQGKANHRLLDSYHLERYPIVKEVVRQNDDLTKLALLDEKFMTKLTQFAQTLAGDNHVQLEKKIGNQLTQLDIEYKDSPIIAYNTESFLLQPGQRALDVSIGQKTLYHYLSDSKYNVLLFTGDNLGDDTLQTLHSLQKAMEKQYPDLLNVYLVCKEQQAGAGNSIVDTNSIIHTAWKIQSPAIYLVRPDTCIAACSQNLDCKIIDKFFHDTTAK